jgi:hypothetical protein
MLARLISYCAFPSRSAFSPLGEYGPNQPEPTELPDWQTSPNATVEETTDAPERSARQRESPISFLASWSTQIPRPCEEESP